MSMSLLFVSRFLELKTTLLGSEDIFFKVLKLVMLQLEASRGTHRYLSVYGCWLEMHLGKRCDGCDQDLGHWSSAFP